jgi:hypothetical protein
MYQIIYLSSSVKYLNVEEIESLLLQCRKIILKRILLVLYFISKVTFFKLLKVEVALLELFESIKR